MTINQDHVDALTARMIREGYLGQSVDGEVDYAQAMLDVCAEQTGLAGEVMEYVQQYLANPNMRGVYETKGWNLLIKAVSVYFDASVDRVLSEEQAAREDADNWPGPGRREITREEDDRLDRPDHGQAGPINRGEF